MTVVFRSPIAFLVSGELVSSRPPPAQPEANPLLAVYLEKRTVLVRFFTARTGSAAEAEDLVQSLYFKVTQIDGGDIRNGLTYLYRLGLNQMIDQLRSSHRLRFS